MAKRSLKLSVEGIRKAKQQFAAKGWTQEYLAIEVGIKTRQPIWKFFAGEGIERFTFFEVCTLLDLDWREVSQDPPAESINLSADRAELEPQLASMSLDTLVEIVRSRRQEKINNQCGILQLFDVSHPVELEKIYVEMNILEHIPSQQRIDVSALDDLQPEDIDRFGLGKIGKRTISALQAVSRSSKTRILSRPGSGKTTFMKHLALECNAQRFAAGQVPIFITVRDFIATYRGHNQPDILDFIHQEFVASDIPQLEILKKLLLGGRVLLLIDGIDEMLDEEQPTALNELRRFCEKYYKNQFVASCRSADPKLSLPGFTDVELAPLFKAQIITFIQKWFGELSGTNTADGMLAASQFGEYLYLPESRRMRRMITNPLFLHLACSIFQHQRQLPINQAKFAQQVMNLLLQGWYEFKGLVYQEYAGYDLPQQMKSIGEFAFITFERKQYLFNKSVMEEYTNEFIKSLLITNDPEEVAHITETLLKTAKSQRYGAIVERLRDFYSFAYLGLQEYAIARKVVVDYDIQGSDESLQRLVQHITKPHWREIFLLTATMLRSVDRLAELMHQKIDSLVAEDPYLQDFLLHAHQDFPKGLVGAAPSVFLEISSSETSSPGFHRLLQQLRKQLPEEYRIQMPELQGAIATYQEIINQWEFTPDQETILKCYYTAQQLLLDCLHNDMASSRFV